MLTIDPPKRSNHGTRSSTPWKRSPKTMPPPWTKRKPGPIAVVSGSAEHRCRADVPSGSRHCDVLQRKPGIANRRPRHDRACAQARHRIDGHRRRGSDTQRCFHLRIEWWARRFPILIPPAGRSAHRREVMPRACICAHYQVESPFLSDRSDRGRRSASRCACGLHHDRLHSVAGAERRCRGPGARARASP